MARQLARDDYTIGWVCALAVELTAAQEMLGEEHQDLPQDEDDNNVYTLGSIGKHNIVLAALPSGLMGIASATAVAQQMRSSFRSIRFGLMVGVGGSVPSPQVDIRLGDVVVSLPEKGHGGVIQYDFGKATPSGFEPSGFLNAPPHILLAAVTKLRAAFDRGRSLFPQHLARFEKLSKFTRKSAGDDVLFEADYVHEGQRYDCTLCKADQQIPRQPRESTTPLIHYGTIACGNQTKKWQPYASAAAAAFAKELLSYIPVTVVATSQILTVLAPLPREYMFLTNMFIHLGTSTTNPGRTLGGLSDQQRREVLQWVSDIPYLKHQTEAFRDVLKGTGQWLLRGEAYLKWKSSSTFSILWIHGIPGAGKTKLMSIIINDLVERKQSATQPIAYFFAMRSTTDARRTDPEEILRSILLQIVASDPSSPISPMLLQAYSNRQKHNFAQGLFDVLESVELISSLVRESKVTHIIIDGLDEIHGNDAHDVLEALESIVECSQGLVRVAIASRDRPDIVNRLRHFPDINVVPTKNDSDIRQFIISRVDRMIKSGQLLGGVVSPELRAEIIEVLCNKAQGMFQWVRSSIQYLLFLNVEADIRKELGRLPPDLMDTYKPIYTHIKTFGQQGRALAHRVLSWLLCAGRALSTTELVAAVSVDSNGAYTKMSVSDIIRVCYTLVVLDRESNIVRLAHLSVQEFLESHEDFALELRHKIVAERCLIACLQVNTGSEGLAKANNLLYEYAAVYWAMHCRESRHGRSPKGLPAQGGAQNNQLYQLFNRFMLKETSGSPEFERCARDACRFVRDPRYNMPTSALGKRSWIREQGIEEKLFSCIWSPDGGASRTPNFTAAVWDFREVFLSAYRTQPSDLLSANCLQQTVLVLATLHQHEKLTMRLLDLGADASHGMGVKPIHCAAWTGNLTILNLLLARGAAIDSLPGNFTPLMSIAHRTPLMMAAHRGHTKIVERLLECFLVLLDSGANIQTRDQEGRTALHLAVAKGSNQIVKRILSCPVAEINPILADIETSVLLLAIRGHQSSIVAALLDDGRIDTKLLYKEWTALFWAAFHGSDNLVEMMLRHAWVNKKENLLQSRIDSLAVYHHGPVAGCWSNRAPVLLEFGDNEESGRRLSTALLATREPVLLVLLNLPVRDPNERDQWGRSPLWWAVSTGNAETATRLIAIPDVDINTPDRIWNLSPLLVAILGNRTAIAHALLSRADADVVARASEMGQTALIQAARLGRTTVVKRLTERPDHGYPGLTDLRWRRTALSWAVGEGHVASAALLLALPDCNLNCADATGRAAISYAAESAPLELVQSMLQHPLVDQLARDNQGRTIFWSAAANDNMALIKDLLSGISKPLFTDSFLFMKDYNMQGPVSAAALNGRADAIRVMLEFSSVQSALEVREHDIDYRTPLMLASIAGHQEVVRVLVESYPCIDVLAPRDLDGRMALSLAAQYGHIDLVMLLTEAFKRLARSDDDLCEQLCYARDQQGRTALSWAAEFGQEQVLEYLATVNEVGILETRDVRGRSPLSWAASGGHYSTFSFLLANCSDATADKDSDGHSSAYWAAKNGHVYIASMFNSHVKRAAAAHGDVDDNDGPDMPMTMFWEPHQQSSRWQQTKTMYKDMATGRSLLSEAAEYGQVAVVRALLRNRTTAIDVNSVDNEGRPPVWHAIRGGRKTIV
ncbi:TPR repeat [Fusarium beomiforme]|uniref:TPR repeat n=1 Tax=Fusarium beomiforme TaxID=44412 RepID=A0A9P5AKK3_9HYPO|nr:TPR repeat [Fusarium beomiforme]